MPVRVAYTLSEMDVDGNIVVDNPTLFASPAIAAASLRLTFHSLVGSGDWSFVSFGPLFSAHAVCENGQPLNFVLSERRINEQAEHL